MLFGPGDHGLHITQVGHGGRHHPRHRGERCCARRQEGADQFKGVVSGEGVERPCLPARRRMSRSTNGHLTGRKGRSRTNAAHQHVVVVRIVHHNHRLGRQHEPAGIVGPRAMDKQVPDHILFVRHCGGVVIQHFMTGGDQPILEHTQRIAGGIHHDFRRRLAVQQPSHRGIPEFEHRLRGGGRIRSCPPGEDHPPSRNVGNARKGRIEVVRPIKRSFLVEIAEFRLDSRDLEDIPTGEGVAGWIRRRTVRVEAFLIQQLGPTGGKAGGCQCEQERASPRIGLRSIHGMGVIDVWGMRIRVDRTAGGPSNGAYLGNAMTLFG